MGQGAPMPAPFDYDSKTWGSGEVRLEPTYLGALRLRYCLTDLHQLGSSPGSPARILEIGCGAGAFLRALHHYRPELALFGCDISLGALGAARANGALLSAGDAHTLPYAPSSFDGVLMFDVLEHLERPGRVLAEVRRILRPGGLLHLFVPCEGSLLTLHGLLAKLGWVPKREYAGHIQLFSATGLRSLLEEGGFEILTWRYGSHWMQQVIDLGYFSLLSLLGRNVPSTVEGYVAGLPSGSRRRILAASVALVAALCYAESRLLVRIPGSGVHAACVPWGPQALPGRKEAAGEQQAAG